VRQRCRYSANAVRELTEIVSRELAIFQQAEQKSVYVRAHRLRGVDCERVSVPLIGMKHAHRGIAALCSARFASDPKNAKRWFLMASMGEVAARGAPVSTEARESQRSHRAGIRARSRSWKRIPTSRLLAVPIERKGPASGHWESLRRLVTV
jgi:hypothetical protein